LTCFFLKFSHWILGLFRHCRIFCFSNTFPIISTCTSNIKRLQLQYSCLIGCFEEYLPRNWMITDIALYCYFSPVIHITKQYVEEMPYEFTQYFIKVNQTSLFFWFYFVKLRTSLIVGNGKIVPFLWYEMANVISNNNKAKTNQQIMLPSFWNDQNK
jgi:hypothetical protein